LELLHRLRDLEQQHARRRAEERHWGPRTLDLDILVYGDVHMHTPELNLPHPGAHQRSFVLYPLAELAPELVMAGHGPVRELRAHCASPAIELYEET
jgi:2-amino-4-hydroxy-6-hydroxymethyldihydropteridine diphosphokinase